MKLETWLQENDAAIDWQLFGSPWDAMQRRYNPFRDEQIDAILHASGVLELDAPTVLDLGCGPGILGQRIMRERPGARYHGADGDPLMLAAMQRLVPGNGVYPLRIDMRSLGWALGYQNQFDTVISLTALHWLTIEKLRPLYGIVLTVLKPGGTFVVGDPFLPEDPVQRRRSAAFQQERSAAEKGSTWAEFWKSFYERFPIEQMHSDYGRAFEGSDDGYPISFHLGALGDAGFADPAVHWLCGLRAVYGGMKAA